MSFIVPEAKLVVDSPLADGIVSQFGTSRDWRPAPDWHLQSAEYITPMGAMGPVAELVPRDMDTWSVVSGYNSNVRTVYPDWVSQAASRQFTDGAVYASLDADALCVLEAGEWSEALVARFLLVMQRNTPPPAQAIIPQVIFGAPAVWYNETTKGFIIGRISLCLPLSGCSPAVADDITSPVLSFIADSARGELEVFSLYDYATVLSQGPAVSSAGQGPTREVWVMEVERNGANGSWILIRNLANPDQYWSYIHRNLRMVSAEEARELSLDPVFDGRWRVAVCGAITTFNLTALRYTTRTAYMKPPYTRSPGGAGGPGEFNEDVTWGGKQGFENEGWVVGVTDGGNRPLVGAVWDGATAAARYYRPIIWYATEDRPPVISGATSDAESTDTTLTLQGLEYRQTSRWRGAAGSASFFCSNTTEARFPNWRERGKVAVWVGWDATADSDYQAQKVATAYIPPNGLQRGRTAGPRTVGLPELSVQFEDFWAAKVEGTDLVEFRQAGGRTIGAWLTALGNRLGLPDSMIDCDVELEDEAIPLTLIASEPCCAPRDGQSWQQHIDEVCEAAGIRVGVDKDGDGKLFADSGPPAYVTGVSTVSWELDYADSEEIRWIYVLRNEGNANDYRNAVKITIERGRWAGSAVYYYDPLATRTSGAGTDLWKHISVEHSGAIADALADFEANFHQRASVIQWTGPLRPDLRPDMFVRVSSLPGVGLEVDEIYQIVEHTMRVRGKDRAGATSTFRAVLVAVEEGLTAKATRGLWESEIDNDPALGVRATGGVMIA